MSSHYLTAYGGRKSIREEWSWDLEIAVDEGQGRNRRRLHGSKDVTAGHVQSAHRGLVYSNGMVSYIDDMLDIYF